MAGISLGHEDELETEERVGLVASPFRLEVVEPEGLLDGFGEGERKEVCDAVGDFAEGFESVLLGSSLFALSALRVQVVRVVRVYLELPSRV